MKKAKFIKLIVGILLVATAAAGLWYWENEGREEFTMNQILVAAQEIESGTEVTAEMFESRNVLKENVIKGALNPEDVSSLAGKISRGYIAEGNQVSKLHFEEKESTIARGKSIFVIKPHWIDMRSSSLRGGDTVKIYSCDGYMYFGEYRVAFVKDDNEQEVVAAEGYNESQNILERRMSSRAANHIEIIATLEEYQKIREFAEADHGALMLVQKGAV